jgi:hypothetical protein
MKKEYSRGERIFMLVAVVGIIIFFFAQVSADPSWKDAKNTVRAFQIQRCMGVVPGNISSSTEWARYLGDKSTQIGITAEQLQTLSMQHADTKNPGIMKRCSDRYQ